MPSKLLIFMPSDSFVKCETLITLKKDAVPKALFTLHRIHSVSDLFHTRKAMNPDNGNKA